MALSGLESNDIIEGFICPMCMEDLGSVKHLTSHVESNHNTEEKFPLQAMKGIIGKAKKKLLKPDEEKMDFNCITNNAYLYCETLPVGIVRSHFDLFKTCRGKISDRYAIETNKILIRLDKLITNIPLDPIQRKIHEKKVVDWISDEYVGICIECGRPFNLARRRHHCRLCGAVICNSCSMFLCIEDARKMVEVGLQKKFLSHLSPSKGLSSLLSKARNGSSGSLNSMLSKVDPNSEEFKIRICGHCDKLLSKRNLFLPLEDTSQLCALYNEMYTLIQKTSEELPSYLRMCESLNVGETQFTLQEAMTLQVIIMRQADKIDKISKQIAESRDFSSQEITPTMLKLRGKIRLAATNFLKGTMLGLPSPPSEDKLQQLITSRKAANQRFLEAERLNNYDLTDRKNVTTQMIKDTGWGPASISLDTHQVSKDPLLEQIRIIQEYIKQARDANKYDEIIMLESNLKDLKLEYMKNREANGN